MEIIGFILCGGILAYWLAGNVVAIFDVSFAIQMGGGKRWHYWFPLTTLALNVYLWNLLFQNAPFTVGMK